MTEHIDACEYSSYFQLRYRLEQFKSRAITVHTHSHHAINFPCTDVEHIYDKDDECYVYVNFFGLTGTDSPLPHYFIDLANGDSDKNVRIRDFLHMLETRYYDLLYEAWLANHPHKQLAYSSENYLDSLVALSGNILTHEDRQEFAYAHIFGARIPAAALLLTMLQNHYPDHTIAIKQRTPRWTDTLGECVCALGVRNNQLADNALLGQQFYQAVSHIEIVFSHHALTVMINLLSNQSQRDELFSLIERYLGCLFGYDVLFELQFSDHHDTTLTSSHCLLGLTTALGSGFSVMVE